MTIRVREGHRFTRRPKPRGSAHLAGGGAAPDRTGQNPVGAGDGRAGQSADGCVESSKKVCRWKRCRRRVRGLRDEGAFRAEHARSNKLRQGYAQGVIDSFYFDQGGFNPTRAGSLCPATARTGARDSWCRQPALERVWDPWVRPAKAGFIPRPAPSPRRLSRRLGHLRRPNHASRQSPRGRLG